jgi:hypothetical protein
MRNPKIQPTGFYVSGFLSLALAGIKITVDTYGHLVPGANRQAVNRLPSLGGFQVLKQKEKKG